ncbi:PqqD family peptide modification chaperone [Micromonospora sp. RTGN7]|uniref:PqqD family peptide modification chaperone n=1 Tax=Micromonospora sp. RTGN7 TaxID=3016526 RepID=UPI0029FF2746|nr:PqqD family peptide modification chaperone [Micromonospora sp. RTGN7]
MIALDADSRPRVGHLVVREEDADEYVVGDPATGNFVVVPEVGARLVRLLAAGRTVAEAAEEVERETGEAVDALDFVEVLVDAGIIDGRTAEDAAPPVARHWSVSRIPARVVRPLFGRVAWAGYAGCLVATVVMFAAEPSLLPTYEDTFIFPDIVLSLLITNVVVIALTIVHEVWHALAGAAVGVPSRLRIERRGIFPVLETDLSGLWALPPERRYGPFLAGMAIDCVLLFGAVAPRFAWSRGWIDLPPGLVRFLAMVVFSQAVKLAFQTLAYLRTDMYLVMATATGCRNLHQVTRLSLKRLVRRLDPQEAAILRDAHARDLRVSRWYRLLYVAGLIWMAWFVVHFLWPSAKVTFGWAAGVLVGAPFASSYWWEGIALLLFTSLNVLLPLGVVVRNRIRGGRAAT